MAKPIISKFSVLDGRVATLVPFVCYDTGASTVNYIIRDNADGNIRYDRTAKVEGLAKSPSKAFRIPAATIENRLTAYYVQIKVTNTSGEVSDFSDSVLFYAHDKPILSFADLSTSKVTTIPFPSYSFDLKYTYNQSHSELLNSCQFFLYDADKNVVDESKMYYGSKLHSYQVDGLDDGYTYYVRAVGQTLNGYALDTGYNEIHVSYDMSQANLMITAENDKTRGGIHIKGTLAIDDTSNYSTLKVKRRKLGEFSWTTIFEKDVSNNKSRVSLDFYDYYALGRKTKYHYALVPTISGIEQAPATAAVESDFDGAVLADLTTHYLVGLEPKVESVERVRESSVVTTLNGKYPYVFYGSEANYYTGQFSGTVIKYLGNDQFDFDASPAYREEMINWLSNGEPKVLKMWDGRGWIMNVTSSISNNANEHPDKVTIGFSFTEVGDLNSTMDLKDCGLIETV